MKQWIIQETEFVGRQILENPLVSFMGAIGMLLFQYGLGANKTVLGVFIIYLLLICMDWLTGTSAAKKDNIDTSEYGIEGCKRTVFLILTIAIARIIDIIMSTKVVVTGIVIAALARSITRSVIANTKRAGWDKYLPEWLLHLIFNWLFDWVADEIARKDARAKQRLEEIQRKHEEEKR